MNYFLQAVMIGVWLVILPYLSGSFICGVCKIQASGILKYLAGILGGWTIFQLFAVFAIMLKQTLSLVTIVWCACMMIMAACRIVRFCQKKDNIPDRKQWKEMLQSFSKIEWLLVAVMIVLVGYQMFMYGAYQHIDLDDARYIANAVAAKDTDRMLLTHPDTGEALTQPIGELAKEVVSPWSIYVAMMSRLTFMHPATLSHTVLAVLLTVLVYCILWMISSSIFHNDRAKNALFVIVAGVFNIWGYASKYSSSTFMMTRIWQGKSIVAAILIPAIFLFMLQISEKKQVGGWYVFVFMATCSSCLMSGMGIIFSAILVGSFTFAYAVMQKSWRVLLYGIACCIPNLIYIYLYAGL